jgi:YhcG PDDEXK nuclease domain/DUF1016 N-terminal domain
MKSLSHFYVDISKILLEARQKAYISVNSEMIMAYWRIGKRIIEEEQSGEKRAEYGAFPGNKKKFLQERQNMLKASPRDIIKDPYVLEFLKVSRPKETHQDIGQMDMYVRMFEDLHTTDGDNSTIGITLCGEKDQALVRYSVLDENKQIFASKYKLVLPTPEELKAELEREIHFHKKVHGNMTAPNAPLLH